MKVLFHYCRTIYITVKKYKILYNYAVHLPARSAMTLTSLASGDSKRVTMLGSMLFLRSVSGTRVISGAELKEVAGYKFEGKSSFLLQLLFI